MSPTSKTLAILIDSIIPYCAAMSIIFRLSFPRPHPVNLPLLFLACLYRMRQAGMFFNFLFDFFFSFFYLVGQSPACNLNLIF